MREELGGVPTQKRPSKKPLLACPPLIYFILPYFLIFSGCWDECMNHPSPPFSTEQLPRTAVTMYQSTVCLAS